MYNISVQLVVVHLITSSMYIVCVQRLIKTHKRIRITFGYFWQSNVQNMFRKILYSVTLLFN